MFWPRADNSQPCERKKSLLRDLLLQVCFLHEMAAVSSVGPGGRRRRGAGVAQLRQKVRQLWL